MVSSFSGALARYILALTAIASTAISAAFVFTDYNFIKFCVIDGTEAVVCTGDIFNTISSSINEIVNEDESEFARISAIIALSSGALGTLLAPIGSIFMNAPRPVWAFSALCFLIATLFQGLTFIEFSSDKCKYAEQNLACVPDDGAIISAAAVVAYLFTTFLLFCSGCPAGSVC